MTLIQIQIKKVLHLTTVPTTTIRIQRRPEERKTKNQLRRTIILLTFIFTSLKSKEVKVYGGKKAEDSAKGKKISYFYNHPNNLNFNNNDFYFEDNYLYIYGNNKRVPQTTEKEEANTASSYQKNKPHSENNYLVQISDLEDDF